MSRRDRVVAAAKGAVGATFRLHGRNPAYGLDCVGLAGLALRAGGYDGDIPADYPVRGWMASQMMEAIDAGALVRTDRPAPGDLLLFAIDAAHFHLGIKTPGGIVHADASLRRVVERPGVPPWPLVAAWTLTDEAFRERWD